jgi:TonB-dependent starch-binding outer membrane protein SusC
MKKNLLFVLLLGFMAFNTAWAQSRKITGRVTSADDGQPLPGVSVQIQGTKQGVLTDGDGNFELRASTGQVLTFSFVGFDPQQVTVPSGNFPPIRLKTNTRILSEVVVNDGYTKQAKKAYTGAAAVVSGAENEDKPFSNVQKALQGEVAGLNISVNSGAPGANTQVQLRGIGSFALNSNPLYVIDGMIINSGDLSRITTSTNVLAGINEDDIESVTVLKDAAATAIYGSRGSNGVILITTKKGKSGKTQVRFDAEVCLMKV